MSALEDLKEISLNKISPLEASVIYLSRDYESDAALAAAELAALTQRLEAAEQLMRNLPESEIELAREVWGNTNTRIILEARRKFAAALVGDA